MPEYYELTGALRCGPCVLRVANSPDISCAPFYDKAISHCACCPERLSHPSTYGDYMESLRATCMCLAQKCKHASFFLRMHASQASEAEAFLAFFGPFLACKIERELRETSRVDLAAAHACEILIAQFSATSVPKSALYGEKFRKLLKTAVPEKNFWKTFKFVRPKLLQFLCNSC